MAVFWSDLNLSIKILCLLAKFFIGRDLYFQVCGCEPIIWQKSACNLNGFYLKKSEDSVANHFFFYSINCFSVSLITNAVNYFTGSLIDEFRKFHRKHLMRDYALHCVGVIFTFEALWIFLVVLFIINPVTLLSTTCLQAIFAVFLTAKIFFSGFFSYLFCFISK